MNWFFVALLAPALWAVSNHTDKYLINRYFKGTKAPALIIFTGFTALALSVSIAVFHPGILSIPLSAALFAALGGLAYAIGLIPYCFAIQKDEASRVIPLFQLTPVFVYVLGLVFLDETLSIKQLVAALIIIGGAILLSLELSKDSFRLNKNVLGLVALSALLLSLNPISFKIAAEQSDFWTAGFWSYGGIILAATILLVGVRTYRQAVISLVRQQRSALGIVAINESVMLGGRLSFWLATTLAPAALVQVVSNTQSLFVFIYGIFLTVFIPRFGQESILKVHLIQKIISILIILLGSYLLLTW